MATLDDSEHLENEINTPNPREYCDFEKQLQYTLDLNEEEIVEFRVTDGQLPLELELNNNTGFISGNATSPDDWKTEISNYLLEEYAEMEDWETPFPGSPNLTIGELKKLDQLHISGKNYTIFGIKAYYRDDKEELAQFNFEITLETTYIDTETGVEGTSTTSKWFYIQIVPNIDPEAFINSYGDTHNNLKNDDMEVLSPEEYIEWRKSQGHIYPSGCT